MASTVLLEGTTLEGGGQLLRIALGISALTSIPIEIVNIRGKRSGGGGLKAQHLSSALWLGRACHASIKGAGLKSKQLVFAPSTRERPSLLDYHERRTAEGTTVIETQISQKTPGSIGLIFQAILPFILFSGSSITGFVDEDEVDTPKPVRIRITGGTNASMSPSFDYISEVLLPTLSLIGLPPTAATVHSRGYTQGSTKMGSMSFTINPLPRGAILPGFSLTNRGPITHLKAIIIAPKSTESHIREELEMVLDKRKKEIFEELGVEEPKIDISFEDSGHEKRYYLLLIATASTGHKLGRDWLYDHGVRPGKLDIVISSLVKRVVGELVEEIQRGGCVDEYLRDQLVVFQALAKGRSFVDGGKKKDGSLVEPSLHARTAEWVASEVLGVEFDGTGGCEGIGLEAGEVFAERTDNLVERLGKLQV